jgi:uncharacterized repeat protein (TIGR02543 family)
MNGSNFKKSGIIVLAALVLTVCFTVFLLVSNFKPSVYAVTFMNGDTAVEVFVEEGRLIVDAPKPDERANAVFDGWFKDVDCTEGNEWVFEVDTVKRDTVLYAKWTVTAYIVYFYERSVIVTEGLGAIIITGGELYGIKTVPCGEKLSIEDTPAPTRAGRDLDGWETEDRAKWNFDNPINDNLTLYASWKPHKYTVTFMDGTSEWESVKVDYDDVLEKPDPDPSVQGKRFLGWYTTAEDDEDEGELFKFGAAYNYTEDITLYSRYETIVYKATYVFLDLEPQEQCLLFNELFTAPDTPERNAKEFLGWCYYDEGALVAWNFNDGATRDLVLYETWRVKVSYFGYSEYDDKHLKTGETATNYIPAEKEGFIFMGWYTGPEFETEWNFDDALKENLGLYPRFDVLRFEASFYNGENLVGHQVVDYGKTFNIPAEPTPPSAGAFFGGWYFKDADENTVKLTEGYVLTENTVFIAVWWTDDTLVEAPVETVRAYYYEKLVAAAVAKQGDFWRDLASGILVAVFEGEASRANNYTAIKAAYDASLFLINLL